MMMMMMVVVMIINIIIINCNIKNTQKPHKKNKHILILRI